MPELPEVEYTRRRLSRWLKGATITEAVVHDPRIVRPATKARFTRALAGEKVADVARRGKWICVSLAHGNSLFVHLGMTGWFELSKPGAELLRFERVSFELTRGKRRQRVAFVDSRRWGRLIWADADIPAWRALGPDPLSDGLDADALAKRLGKSKTRSIKEALLDQTVLAGVGNIQAIEALWRAKIDPRSHARALTLRHVRSLISALHWTIARTLKDLEKGDAGAKNPFRIYGRKGEPCPRCKTTLTRIELGGRTTTFCTGCQVRL